MTKPLKQYLLVCFAITYLCFGSLVLAKQPFIYFFEHFQWLPLLVLGCLGPLAGAVFVHLRDPAFGGAKEMFLRLKAPVKSDTWRLAAFLLAIHYGLAWLLGLIPAADAFWKVFLYLPPALLLFGGQELGWRLIVQPELEKTRGWWKSSLATGLLWAVWFLPLLYLPGFVIRPDFFLQFAAYLAGAGFLLTTLYKRGDGILPCIVFSAAFFALTAILPLRQNNAVVMLAIADVVIAVSYLSKRFE